MSETERRPEQDPGDYDPAQDPDTDPPASDDDALVPESGGGDEDEDAS